MTEKRSNNRREFVGIVEFPLTDSHGENVMTDRRSGFDRRNHEYDQLAFKILSITNPFGNGS